MRERGPPAKRNRNSVLALASLAGLAISAGLAVPARAEGSRFRWNVEVLWPVETYLRAATPEKRAGFLDAVRWNGILVEFDFETPVEKCVPGTQCRADVPGERTQGGGWISAFIVLSMDPIYLPVGERLSIAKATYVLKKDVGRAGTKIEFSNQLAWKRSPPVDLGVTVNDLWPIWVQVTYYVACPSAR